MTVRELIEELKKLDQDKGIWVIYDGFLPIEPVPDTTADVHDAEYLGRKGLKEGDYVISAG